MKKYQKARAMATIPPIQPTTPPTMARVFEDDGAGVDVGEGEDVGVDVAESVPEVDAVDIIEGSDKLTALPFSTR